MIVSAVISRLIVLIYNMADSFHVGQTDNMIAVNITDSGPDGNRGTDT